MNLETAKIEDFTPAVGTEFHFLSADGVVAMELEEIRPLGHQRAGAIREPFALLFRSLNAEILPQSTYPVSHPSMGDFGIFIVPVGRAAGGGTHHEAIFT